MFVYQSFNLGIAGFVEHNDFYSAVCIKYVFNVILWFVSASFEASRISFGHFKANSLENVTINETEVRLSLRNPTKYANRITITIQNVSIAKMICHLGSHLKILFYVLENVAENIHTKMQFGTGRLVHYGNDTKCQFLVSARLSSKF